MDGAGEGQVEGVAGDPAALVEAIRVCRYTRNEVRDWTRVVPGVE